MPTYSGTTQPTVAALVVGSGRTNAIQSAVDAMGQVRAPQYVLGNPISGSSITYGAVTANNLLPPPMFQGGTGALTSVGVIATGSNPKGVAVDPSGRFVFLANSGSNTLQAYVIDQSTGILTSAGTAVTSVPMGVAVDPTGRFCFATNNTAYTIQPFTINQSTGALTPGTAVGTGTSPEGVAADPAGRFVYVANYGSNTVQPFTINQSTGELTAGTAVTAGTGTSQPRFVAVEPTGRFLFVTTASNQTIQPFSINQSTGALTAGTAVALVATSNMVATDPTGRFLFVALAGVNNTILPFSINQSTGALTAGTGVASGNGPAGVAVDPTGRFVIATNNQSQTIQPFAINQSTGALTAGTAVATFSGVPVTGGAWSIPWHVAVDPTGRFAFVVNQDGPSLQTFRINTFAASSGAFQDSLTVGPPTGGGSISINSAPLILSPQAYSATAGVANKIRLWGDPNGQYGLGISGGQIDYLSDQRHVFWKQGASTTFTCVASIATTVLTVTGTPGGVLAVGQTIVLAGKVVEGTMITALGTGTGGAGTYTVSISQTATSGTMTVLGQPLETVRIDNTNSSMTIGSGRGSSVQASLDVKGQARASQHIIGNPVSGSSITYGAVNANTLVPPPMFQQGTGALTSVGTAVTGTTPRGVAIDPSGRFAIVANYGGNTVQPFTINQSTGALTAGTAVATMTSPYGIAIDPTGRYAYVCGGNTAPYGVQPYTINQVTGALTAVGTAATAGATPNAIAVDPTGRFVYITNQSDATVQGFSVTQGTGALTSVGTQPTGTGPFAVVADPTGRFVFVANQGLATVQAYTINQVTGALTSVGTAAAGTNPRQLAVEPTGRFLFVTNYGSNTVQPFSINQSTGALTPGTAVATGTTPHWVAADPTGRYVFVANSVPNTLGTYLINQSTGDLTLTGTAVATGTTPYGVAVDPTGRFAFVTNNGAATLQSYRITVFGASSGTFQDFLDIKGKLSLSGSTSGSVSLVVPAAAGSATYTLPGADGTTGQALSTNGSGTLSWATAGITQVTFAESTAAPNATVYVDSITAAGASANVDLALSPKGTGALTAQVADSTTAGGNKRGTYSVDWQTTRASAGQSAIGPRGVISGGYANTISGSNNAAVIAGGSTNIVNSNYGVIGGGYVNTSNGGWDVVAGGWTCGAYGGNGAVGGGMNNTVSQAYGTIPGGAEGYSALWGKLAYASGKFTSAGDAQFGLMILRGTTTSAATVLLTANAAVASATNHTILLDNRVFGFRIDVIANSGAVGTSGTTYGLFGGQWTITGLARRATGVGTTTIIGTPYVTANADASLQAVTVAVAAETVTYGSLQVTVGGLAATNIHWVGQIQTTEVG